MLYELLQGRLSASDSYKLLLIPAKRAIIYYISFEIE